MKRRLQYAALTRSWARDAPLGDQLEELASELEDATLELDPAAALACRRFLTDPTVSPLFDDVRDADELRSAIARVRAGFRPHG
jgi:hypothetical protein